MDQIVKNTTERLLRKLNPEQPFYTPSDMLEAGFPAFVVERIRLELETNLADSILPPSTDWAIMNAEEVTGAWQQFLDAIHNQLRLPNSYAKGVIESSVADLFDILTEPRKNLPDYLFVSSADLYPEEIEERMRWVVVYPHFASFLPRYMKAKKLDKITKERYASAIAQIDDKLSARYSPLNWAQLLKPLFTLCNEELEPEVIGRFFRDKNMLAEAERFESQKDPLDDHQFIELLSKPSFDEEYPSEIIPAATFTKSKVEKHGLESDKDDDAITPEKTPAESEETPDSRVTDKEDDSESDDKPLYSTLLPDADDDDDSANDQIVASDEDDDRRTSVMDNATGSEEEVVSDDDSEEKDETDIEEYIPLNSRWSNLSDNDDEEDDEEEDDSDEPVSPFKPLSEDEEDDKDEESSTEFKPLDEDDEDITTNFRPLDEEDDDEVIPPSFKPLDEDEDKDESEPIGGDNGKAESGFSPLYARFQQASDEESGNKDDDDELEDSEFKSDQGDEPVLPKDFSRETQDYDSSKDETDEAELTPSPVPSGLRSVQDEDDTDETTAADEEEGDEEYIPLWKRLSADDDDEGGFPTVPVEERESEQRRAPIESPSVEDESDDDGMARKLIGYLEEDRKAYTREIFKNDDAAYINALVALSEFKNWREAGKYLTNEIFRKNGIDMYKDVTVDFTDRLHKFFTDNMRR
ncbi:MAG: hypothetical protein LAT84_13330 [Balneolia bacterium]|nr:hypothetical protein [Balneolia bacterium]